MKRILILTVLMLLMLSCATNNKKMDALLKQYDKKDAPGLAIGIIQNGKLVYSKGFGVTDLKNKKPITADTKFHVASVSKQFTAAAIIMLFQQKKLNLDDDIKKYFPELPEYKYKITIRNLLNHTSGIKSFRNVRELKGVNEKNELKYYGAKEHFEMLKKLKGLNFKPGEKYLYSNSGYFLLGKIVEKVSGVSLREFTTKHIFKPLGMKNTFFTDNYKEKIANLATSYYFDKKEKVLKKSHKISDSVGHFGLVSTINDLYLWEENFHNNNIGKKGFMKLFLQKGVETGDWFTYGFGLQQGEIQGKDVVFHDGNYLGYLSLMSIFPKEKFSIIVLANRDNINLGTIFFPAQKIYTSSSKPSKKQVKANFEGKDLLPKKDMDKLVGFYYFKNQDSYREIYKNGDVYKYVIARTTRKELTLKPTSETEFTFAEAPFVILRFVKNGKKITMVSDAKGKIQKAEKTDGAISTTEELKKLVGIYYNDEIDENFEIKHENDSLVLDYKFKPNSVLKQISKNKFVPDNRFISIEFKKNEFIYNHTRIKGLLFKKTGENYTIEEGTVKGSLYKIAIPKKWNKKLLLIAHGGRPAKAPLSADFKIEGTEKGILLNEGWMIAETSYRRNGIFVNDGVEDLKILYDLIAQKKGKPDKTYIIGFSMGGKIVVKIAEQKKDRFDGILSIGVALLCEDNDKSMCEDKKNMKKLTFKPQIPILFFSNITELTEVNEYIEKTKKNAVLWTSPRRGHCNINGPEGAIAVKALTKWVERSEKPVKKDVRIDVNRKNSTAKHKNGKIYAKVLKVSKVYGSFNVDLTRKDLEKAGIKQDSHLWVGFKDKKFKTFLGYSYGDVKQGEWITFLTAADYLKVARNWENAQKLLGCKEGDEVFFEVMKTDRKKK